MVSIIRGQYTREDDEEKKNSVINYVGNPAVFEHTHTQSSSPPFDDTKINCM